MKRYIFLALFFIVTFIATAQDGKSLVMKTVDSSTGDVCLVNKDPIKLKSTNGVEAEFVIKKMGKRIVNIYAISPQKGSCADKNSLIGFVTDDNTHIAFLNKYSDNCDGTIMGSLNWPVKDNQEWVLKNHYIKTIVFGGKYFPSLAVEVDKDTAIKMRAIFNYLLTD